MAHSSGAAAPITPSFTLADARNMLHQHAYSGDRRRALVARKISDYGKVGSIEKLLQYRRCRNRERKQRKLAPDRAV